MPRTLVAVVLLGLLAGCRVDGVVDVTVDGDGGGSLVVELAPDAELRRTAAAAGVDPLADVARAVDGLAGWRATRPDDRPEAVRLTSVFDDPSQLRRRSAAFAEGLAGTELDPLSPLVVTVGDTVALDGAVDLRATAAADDLGLDLAETRAAVADAVAVTVVARMPGTVLATGGGERVDDEVVRWRVAGGQRQEIAVRAERPWTVARIVSTGLVPAVVTAVVLALLVAVAVPVVRRRRRAPVRRAG